MLTYELDINGLNWAHYTQIMEKICLRMEWEYNKKEHKITIPSADYDIFKFIFYEYI